MYKIEKIDAEIFYEENKPYLKIKYKGLDLGKHIINCDISKIDISSFDIERIFQEKSIVSGGVIYWNQLYKVEDEIKFKIASDIIVEDATPPKEMTLKDVENKLGYKIKIISD